MDVAESSNAIIADSTPLYRRRDIIKRKYHSSVLHLLPFIIMSKAIAIRQVEGKPGQVYYPLEHMQLPEPKPKDNEVVVKITAAALNHRDLFIRQHLYPGTTFGVPLLADGTGIVVATGSGSEAQRWKGKRVMLNPGNGWKDDPEGPESPKGYAILGGTKTNPLGTLAETVTIDAGELEEAPNHLSSIEAAALPLTGLTAWRAVMSKSQQAKPGRNILITGIGGGVALMALLFASAAGANVYVSSSSEEKLKKAKALGAAGGVNYKEEGWEKKLLSQLPAERKTLDAIIDGAGGDVVEKGTKMLRVCTRAQRPISHADIGIGRRRHRRLWYDHQPQDALPHERRPEEHRRPRQHDGQSEGVRRHGEVRRTEELEAGHLTDGVRAGQPRRHQQSLRRHEEREPVWQVGDRSGEG